MMPYLTKKPSLGTPAALLLDQAMAACVTTLADPVPSLPSQLKVSPNALRHKMCSFLLLYLSSCSLNI